MNETITMETLGNVIWVSTQHDVIGISTITAQELEWEV